MMRFLRPLIINILADNVMFDLHYHEKHFDVVKMHLLIFFLHNKL